MSYKPQYTAPFISQFAELTSAHDVVTLASCKTRVSTIYLSANLIARRALYVTLVCNVCLCVTQNLTNHKNPLCPISGAG